MPTIELSAARLKHEAVTDAIKRVCHLLSRVTWRDNIPCLPVETEVGLRVDMELFSDLLHTEHGPFDRLTLGGVPIEFV